MLLLLLKDKFQATGNKGGQGVTAVTRGNKGETRSNRGSKGEQGVTRGTWVTRGNKG